MCTMETSIRKDSETTLEAAKQCNCHISMELSIVDALFFCHYSTNLSVKPKYLTLPAYFSSRSCLYLYTMGHDSLYELD